MNYLRGFIPWIVFAAMPSNDLKWAAVVALLVGVVLFRRQRRRGVEADAMILEISTIAFFAVLAALAYVAPHSSLPQYTGALSFVWLALTAWGSLAVRHPFTLTGAAVAICEIAGAGTIVSIACEAAGFVLPAIFTARYPKIVQARYANAS